MFSRKEQLEKKTGESGVGRYEFLKQLIHEFATTKSHEAKRQTLANLANFSYDPINYEHLKQLHVTDLFLTQLSENSEDLLHFAIAGLCNLVCDTEIREYTVSLNGVNLVANLLQHNNEEIALNALTTLFYLSESSKAQLPLDLKSKITIFENSDNPRIKNLGKIYMDTYFSS